MTLTPVFGRDYKSRAEVVKDLNAGKDFMANDYNASGYINLSQLQNGQVQVRDKSLRKVWVINIVNGIAK